MLSRGNGVVEENKNKNYIRNENKLNDQFGNSSFNKENDEDDPFADYNPEIKINQNKISNVNSNNKPVGLFEQKLDSNHNHKISNKKITDEFGFELDNPKNLLCSAEIPNLNLNKLTAGYKDASTDRDNINMASVDQNQKINPQSKQKLDTSIDLSSITNSRDKPCIEQLLLKNIDQILIKKYLNLKTCSKEYPVV